ncbi:major facilitator superfamily domain-containing protein [Xylariales sp. PMI_506]|nr:major facilitator superfamily domain-containing protein [Xylariales sp. PMI_506]
MDCLEKAGQPTPIVTITALNSSETTLASDDHQHRLATPPKEQDDDDSYPDGGTTAWLQVVAGHFANAISSGYGSAFGIFQLYYTTTLGLPASQVAWIGSAQTAVNNASCMVGGRLVDAGYEREALLAGSLLTLLGTFTTSLATQYWQVFLAQGICTGMGLGLVWMPATTVVSSYFNKRRSLAMNAASAGTGTGSVIFPAMVQYLIPQIGFAWSVRCLGFVVLLFLVIVNVLLRPRKIQRVPGSIIELKAFKEVPYALYALGTFINFWAFYVGYFYVNTYALTLPSAPFTNTSSVNLLLVLNAMSTPGRLLIGYLGDFHIGRLNANALAVAALGATLYSWAAVSTGPGMYAWAAAFGFTSGAAQGAYVSALPALTADPRAIGVRLGMVCFLNMFATLAGPPLAGAILDAAGGKYLGVQLWSGSVEVLAVLILLAGRWSFKKKLWAAV